MLGAKRAEERMAVAATPMIEAPIHRIVQFQEPPTEQDIQELVQRGARILDYVPDNGLLISAWPDLPLDGMKIAWTGTLLPSDKISGKLVWASGMAVVADFHPDTRPDRMRRLAAAAGLAVRERPDLLPYQLLMAGEPDQMWTLAAADEVAYLYPPSKELLSGTAVRACPGALTSAGRIGEYTAHVGDGWDGPGLNAAALSYFYVNYTEKLNKEDIRREFARAMEEWSNYVQVSFTEGSDPLGNGTVAILFATGDHGDGYPFDGTGATLAHTFYPAPPNPEPLAGDMHLDDDEDWHDGATTDLYSVVLHELGHALGLGHSDTPGTVMYPFYQFNDKLTTEDIATVRELYAARDGAASPQPLALTLAQPAGISVTTTNASIAVSGSVSGGTGAITVSAVADTGASAQTSVPEATDSRTWDLGSLGLLMGANHITVTATDAGGATAIQVFDAFRQESTPATPATPPPAPEPPVVRIVTPSGDSVETSAGTMSLSGSASHPSGISRVEWTSSAGGGSTANGTTDWSIAGVALARGTNLITVTAWASAGTSASASVNVIYAPQPTGPDTAPPNLAITSPFSTNVATSSAAILVQGIAQDDVGVARVTWISSSGDSGTAPGTSNWGPVQIPLLVGVNTITISAFDAAGNTAWRSLTVTRR
jgi:hypothetical protein